MVKKLKKNFEILDFSKDKNFENYPGIQKIYVKYNQGPHIDLNTYIGLVKTSKTHILLHILVVM